MFFWGAAQFLKRRKIKILCYGLVGLTVFATMYTFSRGAYLAILFSVFVLGGLKDRKLLLIGAVFLVTWEAVVPTAVYQRVTMTQNSNGRLEDSSNERVKLWHAARDSVLPDAVIGSAFV